MERVQLDAYINLNFVKEVQFIVEHILIAVFAAVVETMELNREDMIQQPDMHCGDCLNTLLYRVNIEWEKKRVTEMKIKVAAN